MSLWDLIKPKGRTIDYVNNMPPLQAPEMEAIQVQDDGQGGLTMANTPTGVNKPVNFLNRLENKRQGLGNTLSGLLFGKQAQPTDYADTNGDVLNVGISSNPRVGGLVPDIVAGFRENANTPFNPENLGQNRGFAYRLGEGLGTAGRLLSSELGRGLLTAGIVGATGGSGLEALAYGTQAGALNNRLRNEDKIYRRAMLEQAQSSLMNSPEFNTLSDAEKQAIYNQMFTVEDGKIKPIEKLDDTERQNLQSAFNDRLRMNQQEQLNNIANQINGMRGYVTEGVYNNMLKAQQLRDNADYRNLYLSNQQEQNRLMNQLRQDQFAYNQMKDQQDRDFRMQQLANDNAYKNAQLGLGYARLNESREARLNRMQNQNKLDKSLTDNMQTLADIDAGLQLIKENPGAYSWIKGKMGADLANRLDPKGVKTRTQIDNITAVYRKWLTGAQMSDQERKAYERFLPAPSDNANIVINKLQGMKDSIERKNQIIMQNANMNANMAVDNDPLGLGF